MANLEKEQLLQRELFVEENFNQIMDLVKKPMEFESKGEYNEHMEKIYIHLTLLKSFIKRIYK